MAAGLFMLLGRVLNHYATRGRIIGFLSGLSLNEKAGSDVLTVIDCPIHA